MGASRAGSLRTRLTLGLVGLAIVVVALLAAASVGLDRLGGAVGTILRENYDSVIACEDMGEALERLDSAALFSTSGKDELARPMLVEHRRAFVVALERERHNITLPGEGALAEKVAVGYEDYVRAVDRVLGDPSSRTPETYFRELLPRFVALKADVHAILRMNQANMEEMDHAAKAMARSLVRAGVAVTLLALVLGLWLVFWLPSAILKPLDALRATALRVGEGGAVAELPAPRFRELVPLTDAFDAMQKKLRVYRESSLGELLAAKDLARGAVACLDDPVVVMDADENVLLVNAAAERAFGVSDGTAAELARRGVTVPEPIREAARLVLEGGEPLRPSSLAEAWSPGLQDGDRHFLLRAAALRPEPRERPKVLVVAQDVTRLRKIDELKSSVVGTVSHEFKTPLTSLRMATHLLLEPNNGPLTPAQRELVETAKDDTERLKTLVEAFLDLTRIESEAGALRKVAIDLRKLAADAADAHRQLASQKGVELVVSDEVGDAPVALVDPDKMAVALANLVANAVRHTPAGGRIELRAGATGTHAWLSVSDTGEGIEQAELPKIFDRFHRGGGENDGLRIGLGLAIAREIAEQHGGELKAESARGQGAVFTLRVGRDAAASR